MYELPGQGNRPAWCICLLFPLSGGRQHQVGCARPLTQGEEVKVVHNNTRQNAWVRSCPTIIGGVYTLRTSSGDAIMRLRHEIEA